MKIATRFKAGFLALLVLSFGLSLARVAFSDESIPAKSWRNAPSHSAGIAPDPATLGNNAIVQVYAAPTYGWRGLVAVHTWVIFKKTDQTSYTRYDVIGWRRDDVVARNYAIADGLWYGSQPTLLVDHRGAHIDEMISQIESAVASYPYPHTYSAYPGPNSNTFIAHIGREVPALKLDLPANAIGKDYRPITAPVGFSSSSSGVQASLWGLLGLNIGLEEGFEINVLGLNFGIDLNSPALRLPFIGRLGMDDTTRSAQP